jgi:hypothetical protein
MPTADPRILLLLPLLAGCWVNPDWDDLDNDGPLLALEWEPEEAEPIQFGGVERGFSVERMTRVTNVGRLDLSISDVLGPSRGFLLGLPAPVSVAAGESVDLPIIYAPDRAEVVTGFLQLRLETNAPEPPLLAVRANGLAAELDWNTLELLPDRDEPGCVQTALLLVENEGTRPAMIEAIGWEDVEGFTVTQAPEVPFELDPGAAAQVAVAWTRESPGNAIDRVELVTDPVYAAEPGPYMEAVADFARSATDVFSDGLGAPLPLSETPWSEGIELLVDGLPTSAWSYDPVAQTVTLNPAPLDGSIVTASYPVVEGCAAKK